MTYGYRFRRCGSTARFAKAVRLGAASGEHGQYEQQRGGREHGKARSCLNVRIHPGTVVAVQVDRRLIQLLSKLFCPDIKLWRPIG